MLLNANGAVKIMIQCLVGCLHGHSFCLSHPGSGAVVHAKAGGLIIHDLSVLFVVIFGAESRASLVQRQTSLLPDH